MIIDCLAPPLVVHDGVPVAIPFVEKGRDMLVARAVFINFSVLARVLVFFSLGRREFLRL